jgi:hypothetical protein
MIFSKIRGRIYHQVKVQMAGSSLSLQHHSMQDTLLQMQSIFRT